MAPSVRSEGVSVPDGWYKTGITMNNKESVLRLTELALSGMEQSCPRVQLVSEPTWEDLCEERCHIDATVLLTHQEETPSPGGVECVYTPMAFRLFENGAMYLFWIAGNTAHYVYWTRTQIYACVKPSRHIILIGDHRTKELSARLSRILARN